MKFAIPASPFELSITVSRDPDAGWGRLRLRWLLALVAAVAIYLGYARFEADRTTYSWTYPVGDLIVGGKTAVADLTALAAKLESSIEPGLKPPRRRFIEPFYLTNSLIVRDSGSGHSRIEGWLREQRRRPAPMGKVPPYRLYPPSSWGGFRRGFLIL